MVQLYLSSTATADGDEAVGRAYLVELNVPVEGDRFILVGWYDDGYRRTDDGWRFSKRELTKLYVGPSDLSELLPVVIPGATLRVRPTMIASGL